MSADLEPIEFIAKVAFCSTCRHAMYWAWSPAGKRLPIDATPTPEGEYQIAAITGTTPVLRKFSAEPGALYPERYTSHFRTCNAPSAHSRKTKAKAP